MIRAIRLRPEAEKDIYEAAFWYEKQRLRLGHDFLDAAEKTFKLIAEHPLLYPVVHRSTRRALLSRFPFGVYFQIEGENMTVIAVLHASRSPERWRERT